MKPKQQRRDNDKQKMDFLWLQLGGGKPTQWFYLTLMRWILPEQVCEVGSCWVVLAGNQIKSNEETLEKEEALYTVESLEIWNFLHMF